jgi:steroid delta-isomerase-like uncharacterized protein
MSEKQKAITRRIFEEVWEGDLDVVDEVLGANYVAHGLAAGLPPGRDSFKHFVSVYRTAFPDVHFTIEDQIAEENKVVTRWTARGTHKGDLMGIPASGKRVVVTGSSTNRFAGDKSVESWNNWDGLGMMQQIGVIPAMGETAE